MGRFTLCLTAVALLASSVFAEDVITLTQDNFSEVVKNNDKLIVEFYAPWCGHCKKLTPEYESAAGQLKAEGITLAKMDATEEGNKAISAKYGVKGFPTLKIFRGDETDAADYGGPREAAGIVSYAKKQFGPATQELKDAAAIDKATDKPAEVTVLGVFPEGESSAEFKTWLAVANALREDATFVHTFTAANAKDAAGSTGVTTLVYKDFDETMLKYDGAFEKDALIAFLNKASSPKLVTLDQSPKNKKALSKIFADKKAKVLAFVPPSHDDIDAYKTKLMEISASQDKVHILYVDPAANKGAVDFFGLKDGDYPAVCIHEGGSGGKFTLKSASFEKMDKFLADYDAGKLEKEVKSAEIPETNDEPVKVVVAKQFQEIVFSGKDVLIEFYAPWCGHCKTLAPLYEELATKLQDKKHITIAKMDATANDVADAKFDVKGFPTLYFVSGKDGKVHSFNGDRTVEGMESFIAEKSNAGGEDTKDEL